MDERSEKSCRTADYNACTRPGFSNTQQVSSRAAVESRGDVLGGTHGDFTDPCSNTGSSPPGKNRPGSGRRNQSNEGTHREGLATNQAAIDSRRTAGYNDW